MASKDIILVCMTNHPRTTLLLRAGALRAQQTGLPWYVLSIETPDDSDRNNHYTLRFQALAKKMGATLAIRRDKKALRALISFLKTLADSNTRVQHLIIGKEKSAYPFTFFSKFFTKKLRHYVPIEHILILPLFLKRHKWQGGLRSFFDPALIKNFALVLAINAFVTLFIKMFIALGVEFVWLLKGVEAYIFINGVIALKWGFAPALFYFIYMLCN
jgi:K+-sensing histidine kinase KdpD